MNLRKSVMAFGLAGAIVFTTALGSEVQVKAGQNAAQGNGMSIQLEHPFEIDSQKSASGYLGVNYKDKFLKKAKESGKTDLYGAENLPSRYGYSVKQLMAKYPNTRNQGNYGTCWAHSAIGMMEFNMINKGYANRNVDYSELHLAYYANNSESDPLTGYLDPIKSYDNYLQSGGNEIMAFRTLGAWRGAVAESRVPYSKCASILRSGLDSTYAYSKKTAILTDATIMLVKPEAGRLNEVKSAIMKNGSAEIGYTADLIYDNAAIYRNSTGEKLCDTANFTKQVAYDGEPATTYYCPFEAKEANMVFSNGNGINLRPDHAVLVVGWDDNFPASYFETRGQAGPQANGAWLIRNSWSTATGNNISSYFWLSYYDKGLDDIAYSFVAEKPGTYTHNYQYDGGIWLDSMAGVRSGNNAYPIQSVANVFKAKDNENLKAVSLTNILSNTDTMTIDIYTNLKSASNPTSGKKVCSQTAKVPAGMHTVKLNKAVTVQKGTYFAVVVRIASGNYPVEYSVDTGAATSRAYPSGYSYLKAKGSWINIKAMPYVGIGDNCIKAFTVAIKVASPSKLKVSSKSKALKISWKKASKVSGYEIQLAMDKKYKKGLKKVTLNKGSASSTTVKKLKSKKAYYVRVRSFTKVNGVKVYSSWVTVKKAVKTK